MKNLSIRSKIKLVALALCAIMMTTVVGLGVLAAKNESVNLTNSGSVEFVADGFVDANIKVFINEENVGEVEFTAQDFSETDKSRTHNIRNLKETDWLDNVTTTDNLADRYVEFKFIIKNVRNEIKDEYDLLVTGVKPTAPANTQMVATIETQQTIATEDSVTFIYRYDVTGFKDVDFTVQTFAFTLTSNKVFKPYTI